jgi:hypothetical protein
VRFPNSVVARKLKPSVIGLLWSAIPEQHWCGGTTMAKKITRSRPWKKEEVRMLKTLAREQTKTTVIARKLKRSVAAVYLRASKLAVMLGGGRGRKGT